MCVKIGKRMQSNTAVSHEVYLIAILENYMSRPLLVIFRHYRVWWLVYMKNFNVVLPCIIV